jgi:hypothetical protein
MVAPALDPGTGVVQPAFVYHFHEAPLPSDPPITLTEDELPEQMATGVADALVGAVELVLTVTVTLAAALFPHTPSERT